MGQDAEGMAAIRRALAIDPEDASACAAMGRALFIGRARFAEAAEWFARALERNPKGGWYALQLAHCASLLRDFALGERAARQAMELQEAFLSGREGLFIAGAYMRAGHLAALQGRHAEAVANFEREIDFLVRTEHALRSRILVELNATARRRRTCTSARPARRRRCSTSRSRASTAACGWAPTIRSRATMPRRSMRCAAMPSRRSPSSSARSRSSAPSPRRAPASSPSSICLRDDPRFQRLLDG